MVRSVPIICLLSLACGGQPVGSKVPRPDPTHVAVGAAAAATALTLADPDLSGKKPEYKDERGPKGKGGSGETVPESVFERAESGAADADEVRPCEDDDDDDDDDGGDDDGKSKAAEKPAKLELIPTPGEKKKGEKKKGEKKGEKNREKKDEDPTRRRKCRDPAKPVPPEGGAPGP